MRAFVGGLSSPACGFGGIDFFPAANQTAVFKNRISTMASSGSSRKHDIDRHRLELTQFAVDHAAESIFWISKKGRVIYANAAATEQLGYGHEELLQMQVEQIDPHYNEAIWVSHWDKIKNKQKVTIESEHRHKDGTLIPVEIKVSYLKLEATEFYCAFVRNISERKKAERKLLESKSRLRKTLDVTSDGVWDRNLQTGDVYYGAKWATVLGYSEEDLQTKRITWESLLHPDDREKTIQALRDHLRGRTENYEAEFRLKNAAGGWQWIHARGQVIEYDEKGSPLRFVGTHTDITARKIMEESLVRNTEETKLFAYSVAHDLKSPAVAIRGLAERFRRKLPDLPKNTMLMYCDRIIDSASQIVELVEKINDFISSKETAPNFEDAPLKDVVRTTREEFRAQLQYRSIAWEEFAENPTIRMDRSSIVRVLRNLIENSLKYGGPQLSKISIGYQNTPGYHIISVRDNGVGMKVEDSERIFRPFQRKNSSAEQTGSGLGLAIVKEIANRHNGEVWMESNRKNGVKFCFAISKDL